MSSSKLKLQNILSDKSRIDSDAIKEFAIESFAKEVDQTAQNELLTKLIIDHSSISKYLEVLNNELLEKQEMLVEAQEIAKLGRWDIDIISNKMTWSDSLYSIFENQSPITVASEFFSFVHPDDLEQVQEFIKAMYSFKTPRTMRYRLLMKNGNVKWVHLRFYIKFDKNGKAIRFYGTIQDITEMKKIEDKLERYNQHLERLVEEKVEEISSSQMATIYALIRLSESRDDDTGAHIQRTASFCRLLAEKARDNPIYKDEINDSFIETIYKASPLHDIGKVGIADSILLKPGKLTDEEFAIMKTHVLIGYETISEVGQQYDKNEFLKMGKDIALYHHEKWNGSGYTKGLVGDKIPLSARIMAVSDVYDALRSKRVYKEAFSHEKSMDIIESSKGSHFDPTLIDLFIANNDEFRLMYESIK